MKRFIILIASAILVGPASGGAAQDDLDRMMQELGERERVSRHEARRPGLDPKRIINESNSFLKEREPEMNAEEYALYEKVAMMLESNPPFALRLLEAMMNEKEPPSPAFEFILGNVYSAAGDHAKAEASYRSAVNRYPTFLRAWNNLGVLYYMTERFSEAVPCFSKSVALGDREATTFGLLGYSLEKIGNLVSAEMAYMQALAGDPSSSDWKEGLLRICIAGGQYRRAESLVRDLIREQPTETRFWLAYANIRLSENRKLEAITLLEICASTGAAGAAEWQLLGDLYAEHNLVPEAIGAYRKVLGTQREIGERKLLHFAQVLITGRRLEEAERLLSSLPRELTPPGRLEFLQAEADLRIAQQRWAEARKALDELLALAPLNGRALLGLGTTYVAEEDFARAGFAFEAAYRVEATRYRASLELANLELKNRRYDRSVEYLEQALRLQKTDEVEDYLARIKALLPASRETGS